MLPNSRILTVLFFSTNEGQWQMADKPLNNIMTVVCSCNNDHLSSFWAYKRIFNSLIRKDSLLIKKRPWTLEEGMDRTMLMKRVSFNIFNRDWVEEVTRTLQL